MKLPVVRRLSALVLAAVTAVCVLWIILQRCCASSGHYADVRVDNQTVLTLNLQEPSRHTIQGAGGIRLIIVCENGAVFVEHSDCPDKICVHKGRISAVDDTIVCLPARTVIRIS